MAGVAHPSGGQMPKSGPWRHQGRRAAGWGGPNVAHKAPQIRGLC